MADVKEGAAEPSTAGQQYNGWDSHGTPIVVGAPKKEASAASESPAKEVPPEPEGETGAESGTAKTSQEKSEGREAKDRIRQLVARVKELEERERSRSTKPEPSSTPEPKPQPTAAEPLKPPAKPLLADFLKNYPGDYERAATEFEEAKDKWTEDMADYKADQKLLAWQQRQAQEAVSRQLQTGFEQAKARYADFEEKAKPALQALHGDGVPDLLKAAVGSSDVGWDLVYALGSDQVQQIVELAKTNPAKALLVLGGIEAEVRRQLSSKSGSEPAKGEASGKSESAPAKPKPRAPAPVAEVGGRAAPPEDGLAAAAKAGDFRAFEAEQSRRFMSGRR